ncbi:Oxidoreductase calI [Pseudocercospora fuligena]|uniref:Oxidoreductase calI n=1 Tax=Pseudocercospora fuligena TaxID=685502 RepID=A0A8H6RR38_9PEZI|nr:Oxidoreductase calI [Pseudocercospora fuligena]
MDKYLHLNEAPNGPGDHRPTAEQIIEDDDLVDKLTGKTILITGGTAGLGTESARVLRKTGAKVWITARDPAKGQKCAAKINADDKQYPDVEVIEMDNADLDSVRRGAEAFLKVCPRLNILMTNAGIMACPEAHSAQGHELQFATNHLSHFLLFQILKPSLLAASTPTFASRVISLSSAGHLRSNIHPENYNLTNEYIPFTAYAQSKTANILFANEIARLYGHRGIHAWSVHPGIIFETQISRHQDGGADGLQERLTKETPGLERIYKSTAQGAATQVWAAVGKALEGKGGKYLEDLQVSWNVNEGREMFGGHRDYVYDVEMAGRLWRDSNRLVGWEEEE